MDKNWFKKYVLPVAVMSGSIGVGFLSLPYVAMRSGIFVALAYLAAMAFIVAFINIIFSEISLKTPDFKRFPGFAGYHLGKWGKAVSLTTSLLGTFGVLLAYLIAGGQFITAVMQPLVGGSNFLYTFIYFAFAFAVVYLGIKAVARLELFSVTMLFLALIFIAVKGFSSIKLGNILDTGSGQWNDFFLPYGPMLFSLWGVGLIPETEEMLRGNKKLLKKVVILGTLIPATIYGIFILLILGITGRHTSEIGLLGLKNVLGNGIISFSLLIGAMVTFVAFIVSGLTLKKVLNFDLKIKEWQAMVIACCTPMLLFLLGVQSFLKIISFIGAVLVGIDGVLILLMYRKINGSKKIIWPLLFVFAAGIIYEIAFFYK